MTFLRVTLPLAMPGVLAAVLIVSIPTVGDYVTPRLVGGSGGTMIANMIYAQIFDLNDRPMGATLAVLAMAIVALTLIWGISRCGSGCGWRRRGGSGWRWPRHWRRSLAIRAFFVLGPAILGAPATVLGLLALATLGSV
jgi:ABC-type Fe3+ transport system permease subunit